MLKTSVVGWQRVQSLRVWCGVVCGVLVSWGKRAAHSTAKTAPATRREFKRPALPAVDKRDQGNDRLVS